MVMEKIQIRDFGYRTAGTVGLCTEIAPGDDGVAGTWLTLNAEEITYNITASINDKPVPNRFENDNQNEIFGLSEVDTAGINVPSITIRGAFNMESSADRLHFAKLVKMVKTQGVKELRGTATTNSWINYINYYDDYYAHQTKSTASVIDHIHVRIASFSVTASGEGKYAHYNLEMRESK